MTNAEFVMMAAVYIIYASIFYKVLTHLKEICPFILALGIPLISIMCFGEQWKNCTSKYGMALIMLGVLVRMVLMVFPDDDSANVSAAKRKPKTSRNKSSVAKQTIEPK